MKLFVVDYIENCCEGRYFTTGENVDKVKEREIGKLTRNGTKLDHFEIEEITKVDGYKIIPMTEKDEIDYDVEKKAIREVYKSIVEFLEEFEATVAFGYKKRYYHRIELGQNDKLNETETLASLENAMQMYKKAFITLQQARLDIPDTVWNKLYEFLTDYLLKCMGDKKDKIWYIEPLEDNLDYLTEGAASVETIPYRCQFPEFKAFCKYVGHEKDDIFIRSGYVVVVVNRAYIMLDVILKDYIKK